MVVLLTIILFFAIGEIIVRVLGIFYKDDFYIADPIEEYRPYADNASLLIINSNKYNEEGHPSPFAYNILANNLNELIKNNLIK